MERGKEICRILKEIRRQIAKANDIEFVTAECKHKGDCAGTCPKCESEVAYLEEQLARLYKQLRRLNDAIEERGEGNDFAGSKDADAILKITAAIKNLETETNIAEKMATGKEFLSFVRKTSGFDTSKEVARLFNAYIKSCL